MVATASTSLHRVTVEPESGSLLTLRGSAGVIAQVLAAASLPRLHRVEAETLRAAAMWRERLTAVGRSGDPPGWPSSDHRREWYAAHT